MSAADRALSSRASWLAVFFLSLVPLLYLIWGIFNDALGANPIEYITHATGDWTLRFLLISLTITPARKLLNLPKLIRFRKMLGLYAFFYGCLHLVTYVWLDKFFDVPEIIKDIWKRPFITVGFFSFVLLVPLALTSTAAAIRRLGGKRWQQLHRLVYVSTIAGVLHYLWLVKSDISLPVMYGVLTAILLSYRLWVLVSKPAKP
jgi:sulfoxide reductase heme-binding subunit YedZ